MVNSNKTPTGKAKKGQVAVRADAGSIKACFPRSYCNKGQIKLATGISLVNGWETKASQLQRRLQIELEDGKLDDGEGNFNLGRYQEILKEYGLQAKLRLVKTTATSDDQIPPKPELSILEIWDMFCNYKKHKLAYTTYTLDYCERFPRMLKQAIEAAGNDPVQIRNWLIENRDAEMSKKLLSLLSKAYALQVRQGIVPRNLFDGLSEDIGDKKRVKIINQSSESTDDEDGDVLDKSKAYTWDEALLILDFVKNDKVFKHWYPYLQFKFFTGCRSGEAAALWWSDIRWEKEQILIRRTYNSRLKIFKPTKNETCRIFPMPSGGALWNLLKSIPQGEGNEVVFKSKSGKTIEKDTFNSIWHGVASENRRGIIHTLIGDGKLSKYLPPYNTRHTFITHQIFDIGIEGKIVNAWCEHSEVVSNKHYQDIAERASRINPGYEMSGEQLKQQSEIDELKEMLKRQQIEIEKLRSKEQD
jgi:integrase